MYNCSGTLNNVSTTLINLFRLQSCHGTSVCSDFLQVQQFGNRYLILSKIYSLILVLIVKWTVIKVFFHLSQKKLYHDKSVAHVRSQNHRRIWLGRDIKDHPAPPPLPWAGTPSSQVAQSSKASNRKRVGLGWVWGGSSSFLWGCEAWDRLPREFGAAPSLGVFKAGFGGALGSLVWWKVFLHMAGG